MFHLKTPEFNSTGRNIYKKDWQIEKIELEAHTDDEQLF